MLLSKILTLSCTIKHDSLQFWSYSLNSLVKNFSKNDFKRLSQGFHSEVLNLVE